MRAVKSFAIWPGRCVAETDLYDLRWMASHQGTGKKVVVFCDDDEAFSFGQTPDSFVVVAREFDIAHMKTARKAGH